jgi:outer membrane lipoprotein SlyB
MILPNNTGDTKMKHLVLLFLSSLAFGLAGCATTFTGSPHVEGGRSACEQKCTSQGMEAAGMVYMGEYSSACVCQVPGKSASRGRMLIATAGAVGGGVAGVEMQRQQNERNRQNQHH